MARVFNGSQYIYVSPGTPVTGTPLTIAALVNLANATSDHYMISVGGGGTNSGDGHICVAYGSSSPTGSADRFTALYNDFGTASAYAAAASAFAGSTWEHGTFIFSASNSRSCLYNGSSKGTDNTSITGVASSTGISIGAWGFVGGIGYMNGSVADVAVWNIGLSDQDAASIGAYGFSPLLVSTKSLVGYWPLGGAYGNTDNDRVGACHMTPYNSPTWSDHPKTIYPCECQCC